MLTSYQIARKCDVVFAEDIEKNQFDILNNDDFLIVNSDNNKITYLNKKLKLFEGAYIFCHTSYLNYLFDTLKKIPEVPKINLVTHQSDIQIDKNIFLKKPNCINNWYGVNINYSDKNLYSIPLGLGNNFSSKNIIKSDLDNFVNNNLEKEFKLYLNFNANTNKKERLNIYELFENKKWAIVDRYSDDKQKYLRNLNRYLFVLCPWGNGLDTHRIWETLQVGSIPVVKYHRTFDYLEDLPVLFINEYKDIDEKLLKNFQNTLEKTTLENKKINERYWFDFIFSSNQKKDDFLIVDVNVKLIKYKKQIYFSTIKFLKYPIKLKGNLIVGLKKYFSR